MMSRGNVSKQAVFILPSKLEIPLNPVGFVLRPNLTRKLLDASQQRLTRVVAPLGSGKTCALVDFAQQYLEARESLGDEARTPPLAWLTLDAQDNDPVRFWSYVFAALAMGDAAQVDGEQVTNDELSRAAAIFYERACGNDTLLVIDRFEVIENRQVEEGLLYFMSLAPRALHVVVVANRLSRTMDFGSYDLGRTKLDYYDFMFRPDEAEQLVRALLGDGDNRLTDADYASVYAMTEGWAQGLSLAAQVAGECALRNVDFTFGGTNSAVDRFFSASARPRLDAETYSFALELSVFERFSGQLCAKVFKDDEVQERFLEIVHDGNILAISCDVEGEWYRFNNLFADWLRNEALQLHEDVLRRICLKASEWFYEHEQMNEAAKYLLMAGDFGYMENIAYATCGLRRSHGVTPHLVWLGRVRATGFPESPLLCMLSAWAFNAAGHVADCLYWLDRFEESSGRSVDEGTLAPETVAFSVKCLRAKCMAMVGSSEEARALCYELLDASETLEPALVSTLYQSLGEAEEGLGNILEAREMCLQAQASADVDKTVHQLFFNMLVYSDFSMRMGNLDEAQSIIDSVLRACPRSLIFLGGADTRLATIYLERNKTDDAEAFACRAVHHLSLYMNVDFFMEAKISEASCLEAQGKLSDANKVISGIIMQCEQMDVPRRILFNAYFKRAEIAMKSNNVRDIQIMKRKYAERLDSTDAYRRVMFDIICGFEQHVTGNGEEAVGCYERAAVAARGLHAPLLETKALVYELSALSEGDGRATQDAVLRRCISLAMTHKLVRSILDGGRSMFEALKNYASNKHAGASVRGYVKLLLAEFGKEQRDGKPAEYAVDTAKAGDELLSPREREVLKLLDMGMNRQEIADTLSISLNTAKKHLSNIYSKLGVNTREQALKSLADR